MQYNRRHFFKKTLTLTLPILGFVAFKPLNAIASNLTITDCNNSCQHLCNNGCHSTCKYLCHKDGCTATCMASCRTSCRGMCDETCKGSAKATNDTIKNIETK